MLEPEIKFTESACNYIKKMLQKEKGVALRISIKKTGCSGYSYAPTIIKEINSNDMKLEVDSIQVFIDTKWIDLLQNLQVDYVEETKTGLQQKRLVFTNPKESSRCGCGESFHVTNED